MAYKSVTACIRRAECQLAGLRTLVLVVEPNAAQTTSAKLCCKMPNAPPKPHPISLDANAGSIRAFPLAGSRAAFARFLQLRVTVSSA